MDSLENNDPLARRPLAEQDSQEIVVVEYEDSYKDAFFNLNRMWIERYWELEPHDIEVLNDPRRHILDQGGNIFVALFRGKPAGVCAMCRAADPAYDYELAKLAVDTTVRRKGIGYRICDSAIAWARSKGARKIFLESNTRLTPAIALYRKLGFVELPELHPAYSRGDIQMSLTLTRE